MSDTNRQWRLRTRPVGMVKESDFELHTAAIPTPGITAYFGLPTRSRSAP